MEVRKMKKKELIKAIKQAKCIFGYIAVFENSKRPVRLSKIKAQSLFQAVSDEELNAEWADDEQTILLIG